MTMKTKKEKMRLIQNAERACKNAQSDWAKNYWFSVFEQLCKKYNMMNYYIKAIH
jgi:arylamine N-acetyltransferase